MYDTLGRFTLVPIKADEAAYKLCRVKSVQMGAHSIPFIATTDGRTIRFADPKIKPNDSVKVDLKTGKIIEHFPFVEEQLACVTGGTAAGRIGRITKVVEHTGT